MTLTAEKARELQSKGKANCIKKRVRLAKNDIRNIFKLIKYRARKGESSVYIDSKNICLSLKALFDDYDLANILESNGYTFEYEDGGYTNPSRLIIEW